MKVRRRMHLVVVGLVLSGVVAIAASSGGASSAGAPPSLGASHRPTTSLGTRAACLQKGEAGLRSASFSIERFQSFVRGRGDDVAALVHCVQDGKWVHLDVIVAGSPGFAAKANTLRICLTDYILGRRSSCGSGPAPQPGPAAQTGGSGWGATAVSFRGRDGQRFRYTCEPNGRVGSVWGTGVYTDDSSVCTAGVHAGLITLAGGGTLVIEIRGRQSAFTGSSRNGITSQGYGSWGGSYVFVT